jgi:thioredoxin reductase/Fe-S-cluster-containing hydrogenase component 2
MLLLAMNEILLVYGLPAALLIGVYLWRYRRRERQHRELLDDSRAAGLTEPAGLHPVVDPLRCAGSASCAGACPEQAIGVVGGLAQLVNPAACIGHGACAAACPFEAIRLVFGTAKRGVDIPQVGPDFQSNVSGIFIAGELGGMGLIHKAATQGQRAMGYLAARRASRGELDVAIVGAGPAGLAAALAAKQRGLRYVLLEQEGTFGGAILHYPRRKVAMTSPMTLPLVGRVKWREIAKESLVDFWEGVVREQRLEVRFREALLAIERKGEGFALSTPRARYEARNVLLCLGRRGTPRKLGVPGEDLPKVVYRLIDAFQYRGRRMLVVGGGDSAIEAALALAGEPGTEVTLSYRGAGFDRVKPANRQRLGAASAIRVLLESNVRTISPAAVEIERHGRKAALPNDDVVVCAGGELPTAMLRSIGIQVQTHFGSVAYSPAR